MTDTNAQKLRIDFLSRLHPDNEVRARPLENHEPAYQLINRSPSRIHITGSVFSWMNHKGQEQACLLCFRIRTRNCQKNSRRRSLEHFDHEERFLNLTSSLMDQNYGISHNFLIILTHPGDWRSLPKSIELAINFPSSFDKFFLR